MHAYIRHINSFHTFNTIIDQYLSKFYQKKKRISFPLITCNYVTSQRSKKKKKTLTPNLLQPIKYITI